MQRPATISGTLLDRADLIPDAPFVSVLGDRVGSYGQVADAALRIGSGLSDIGIKRNDAVAIMSETSYEAIVSWLGINLVGAVEVWVNNGYRGAVLEHALKIASIRAIIIAEKYLTNLLEIHDRLSELKQIVVIGESGLASRSWEKQASIDVHDFSLLAESSRLKSIADLAPSDLASIIFTSGTSGPAKGVMMPHGQIVHLAGETIRGLQLTERDICYCFHPLYHMAGKFMGVFAAMMSGGSIVLDRSFTPNVWLERIRETKATVTLAHGPMIEMIAAQPETARDREHTVQRMMACPLPKRIGGRFQERFGVEAIDVYGMTEIGAPCWTRPGDSHPVGSSGKVDTQDYDFRVVDPETDNPVPPGTVGEFVFRPIKPWILMQGYIGMPEKTIEAWRNLWFHTGDNGYVDADGNLFFLDRGSDRIRRRAENISSYDIESAAQSHPAIRECAAVGVPSEFEGDDDVLLCFVLRDHCAFDPEDLIAFLNIRLPHFMVPRYLHTVEQLPRTPTGKIQKAKLRLSARQESLWDRKEAGVSLRRP